VPVDESHLRLLSSWRFDAESTLVDEVPALLRIGEHLLEHAERELGLPRRAAGERRAVVFDRSRADLVERDRREGVEVRWDVVDAREGRGAHAQRVPLEPAGDEVAERLRRRLVERAKRRSVLLLEDEALGVLRESGGKRYRAR
jgi:hypothetical protein